MTPEQMREKLREWNPSWDVDRFTDGQVVEIYKKERKKLVDEILKRYPEPFEPAKL